MEVAIILIIKLALSDVMSYTDQRTDKSQYI